MSGEIIVERLAESVEIRISNPNKLNALTVAMWRSLRGEIEILSRDERLRFGIIRGEGNAAFSAGADISEFALTRSTREQVIFFHEEIVLPCLGAVSACPFPLIAGIQGTCFGGGFELALLCDIRIASETARFGVPVGRLGFSMAFAETELLYRMAGAAATAELLIEGIVYTAAEAYEKGLVTKTVGLGAFEQSLLTTADNISRSGVAAARAHKKQIRRLVSDSSPVTREERLQDYAFAGTAEYKDGVDRFLKRTGR